MPNALPGRTAAELIDDLLDAAAEPGFCRDDAIARAELLHRLDTARQYRGTEATAINNILDGQPQTGHAEHIAVDGLDRASLKVLLAAVEEHCRSCRRIVRIELDRRIRAALQDDPLHWHSHLDARNPERTRALFTGEEHTS